MENCDEYSESTFSTWVLRDILRHIVRYFKYFAVLLFFLKQKSNFNFYTFSQTSKKCLH